MYGSAVFCTRAWIFTGTVRFPAGKADLGAFKFCSALYGFRAVPAHGMSFTAYRDAIAVDGKVISVSGRASPVGVEVNERDDAMATAVFIVRHCIMGGVEKELCHVRFRQELFQGIPVIKETDRVMPGSRAKKGEDRQVIFRIRCSEHVQVITEIPAFPVGIPSDVTVGLAVNAVTFTIPDSFFKTAAGALFAFLCGGVNGSAVPGNGKVHEVNEAVPVRFQKKKFFEYLEKTETGFHVLRWFPFKFFKKFLDGGLFNGRCLLPFFLWFLGFFLWGMHIWGEVVVTGKPEPGLEVVKSAGSRSIADSKAGKDGVEIVFLEVGSPFCIRSDLELHGKENGAEHVGRKPWLRAEIRIAVLHNGVYFGEVKVPEFLHDFPCGSRKGVSGIRIIFTELLQNTVLVGGMTANVNRFQFRNTPNQKVCTGYVGTKDTFLIKGAERRIF